MSRMTDREDLEEKKPRTIKEKQPEELRKDRDCISCARFFGCKGKPRGINCINYEVRK